MNKQAFALWANGTYTKPWKALELLNKAIGLGPKHVGAYNNWGDAYRCLEEYTKAIQDFNKAVELDPNDAGGLQEWGNFFCFNGLKRQRVLGFEKGL